MAKNDLAVLETLPAKSRKSTVPTVTVPAVKASMPEAAFHPLMVGIKQPVAAYVTLVKEIKASAEKLKGMERYLKERGVGEVFAINDGQSPKEQVSSVRLADVDATEQDPTAMVSVKDAYAAFDTEQAEAMIASLAKVDGKALKADDCLDWEVKATFDTSAFNGPKGFERARYEAFWEALEDVATRFGVENPLQCGKVRVVKEGFHQERFQLLKLMDNLQLHTVLPATVSIRV